MAFSVQGGPERFTHRKTLKKIIAERKWKFFYATFQKYIENIMNRPNFEIIAFCLDHESETGLHGSARMPHLFFVPLGPS